MSPIIGSFSSGNAFARRGGVSSSGLYTFSQMTLSGDGAGSSQTGPSLQQARDTLTGSGVNTWKNNTQYYNVTSGIRYWTVPVDGNYQIETWGSRGGQSAGAGGGWQGGYGSKMSGTFTLLKGDVLKILVGQQGTSSYGGGGGMTAVATSTNTPLIVSGGGNATSPWSATAVNATVSTSGTSGSYAGGGTNGNGGSGGNGVHGGAGFYSGPSGGDGCASSDPPPNSFIDATTPGRAGGTCNGKGGYGGGSGTDGCCFGASGAGGGYSGGAGTSTSSQYGGAGGSYNSGFNQSNINGGSPGAQELEGKVIITLI